jgi:hypothetical protein
MNVYSVVLFKIIQNKKAPTVEKTISAPVLNLIEVNTAQLFVNQYFII